MLDATILIKTFERPACLRRLLASVLKRGYSCPVFIADDSRRPYRDDVVREFAGLVTRYVTLPFDVGLSAGRNALLEQVRTPHFVLCDDDFIFDERTDLMRMHQLLESAELDLLGGVCYDRAPFCWRDAAACAMKLDWQRFLMLLGVEIPRKTFYNFESCGSGMWRVVDVMYTPPAVRCDYVSNFFLARTDRIRETVEGWDVSLKVGEHRAFFLKAKHRGLRVGHTEEVGVKHFRELPPGYGWHRERSFRVQRQWFVQPTAWERFFALGSAWKRIYRHYRSRRRPRRFRGDDYHPAD